MQHVIFFVQRLNHLKSDEKNICFINNFNNEKYIEACLDSVLNQSQSFDEVLVVDDGSIDGSLDIIQTFCRKYSIIKLITKANEGQFSTFNAAASVLPDNAQIFLLDGDDIYPHDYLEASLKAIGRDRWDFAFCEQQRFLEHPPKSAIVNAVSAHYFTNTSALVRSRECWIGNPTSCLSLSTELFKKIFPYPHFQEKAFWADNLMIYAASILGAQKIYLPGLGIGWREHQNNYSRKIYSQNDVVRREKVISQAFSWFCQKYGISRYPSVTEFFNEYDALGKYWQKRLDLPSQYKMFNRLLRQQIKNIFA
ncbi:glycosyltransferase [Polynucleobacter paneuropaeus]|nr:glycosyltransferase [Polynucleobacter paneuropaeus]QWD28741.1 glycosyltransferase [Polynucleobacter paneuropaeus]